MRVSNNQGLNVNFNELIIGLDSRNINTDLVFLSHAHIDHIVKKSETPVITSSLTSDLVKHRVGVDYRVISDFPGLKLLDSGHVPGGKSLFIKGDERVFYTGDFSPHDRFFLKGLRPVKCDTLIIETTYGIPVYDLPKPVEVLKEARDIIEDDLSAGRSVVLWGYAFGKAQLISKLVDGLGSVYAHNSVCGINSICRSHGFDVPLCASLPKRPGQFVYITPDKRDLARFSGSRFYSFTGWGGGFPLSDHAGFTDLLRFVRACSPSRVLTMHGFSDEFASLLRAEGYDAMPIAK